jgi:DNA polymerase III alpha subunit (gram-positive type)
MYNRRFWVDTETTGLDSIKSFAFQISYFIEENNNILLKRTLELRPNNFDDFIFDTQSEKIHGYSKDRIIDMMPEEKAYKTLIDDLHDFSKNRLQIVGYNVAFDINFLFAFFDRNKLIHGKNLFYNYFDRQMFDVIQFVQGFRAAGMIHLDSIALDKVCNLFHINISGLHNSMFDIMATKQVFDKLASMIKSEK